MLNTPVIVLDSSSGEEETSVESNHAELTSTPRKSQERNSSLWSRPVDRSGASRPAANSDASTNGRSKPRDSPSSGRNDLQDAVKRALALASALGQDSPSNSASKRRMIPTAKKHSKRPSFRQDNRNGFRRPSGSPGVSERVSLLKTINSKLQLTGKRSVDLSGRAEHMIGGGPGGSRSSPKESAMPRLSLALQKPKQQVPRSQLAVQASKRVVSPDRIDGRHHLKALNKEEGVLKSKSRVYSSPTGPKATKRWAQPCATSITVARHDDPGDKPQRKSHVISKPNGRREAGISRKTAERERRKRASADVLESRNQKKKMRKNKELEYVEISSDDEVVSPALVTTTIDSLDLRPNLLANVADNLSVSELQAQERELARYMPHRRPTVIPTGGKDGAVRSGRRENSTARRSGHSVKTTNNRDCLSEWKSRSSKQYHRKLPTSEVLLNRQPPQDFLFEPRETPVMMAASATSSDLGQRMSSVDNRGSDAVPVTKAQADSLAVVPSIIWRGDITVSEPPVNLLRNVSCCRDPFVSAFDLPLSEFDPAGELASKCCILDSFGKPRQLVPSMLFRADEESCCQEEMNQKVRDLVDEELPWLERCHKKKTSSLLKESREQVRSYLSCISKARHERNSAASRAVAERSSAIMPWSTQRQTYVRRGVASGDAATPFDEVKVIVGRGDTFLFEHSCTSDVTLLCKLRTLCRSTTCIGLTSSVRTEDDPDLRSARLTREESKGSTTATTFAAESEEREQEGWTPRFLRRVWNDEVREYVMRLVVAKLGDSDTVFNALKEVLGFHQPYTDYAELKEWFDEHRVAVKCSGTSQLCIQEDSTATPNGHYVLKLLKNCGMRTTSESNLSLCHRLDKQPNAWRSNYLRFETSHGVRESPTYGEFVREYRDLFCRMCYQYDCQMHGIEHPLPIQRADPVRVVLRWSPVALSQQAAESNYDVISMDDTSDAEDQSAASGGDGETEVPSSAIVPSEAPCSMDPFRRRSSRSQTVASSLATDSLELQETMGDRKQTKRRRGVERDYADGSEHLDRSFATMVEQSLGRFLCEEIPCSRTCWKSASEMEIDACSELLSSERHVVEKLLTTIGEHSCLITHLLGSKTCMEIHSFLMKRSVADVLDETATNQKKNRKSSRRGGGVNRELLNRTRVRRMQGGRSNHEYKPCSHEGVCDTSNCTCMKREHDCDKACSCPRDCPNRFAGCKCNRKNCRTMNCSCFKAGRECNPDLCLSCGASELAVIVQDPERKVLSCAALDICCNVDIQRNIRKRIGVSFSNIHGWGVFALEPIRTGEFVQEYKGEMISQDEAERRGMVYDRGEVSFLFDLNEESVLDAVRSGNKSKFFNHQPGELFPNCAARTQYVDGGHRIGIFAERDIKVGEELVFDYGYHGKSAPDWSQVRRHANV